MQIIKSSKSSVRTFACLSSALVISTLLVGQTVFAAPFSYEYNGIISSILSTISNINGAGLSVGQSAKITVTLDNGGTTRNSQTWTSAHLKAVTFNFNNGTVITIFYTPFGGSLDRTAGSFVSNSSGNLTSVMTNWADDGSSAVQWH